MKPRNFLTSFSLVMVLASAPAYAAISANTSDFVKGAVIGNRLEIETSQLALQRSKNGAVRDFAQQMIDDHAKAQQTLTDTLRQENLASLAPPALDKKHQKIEDKLTKDSARKFDGDYVSAQIDAHKEAVSLFKKYSTKGDDSGLKNVAATLLPTLQNHLQMANDLKKNYKSNTTANRNGADVNRVAPAAGSDLTDNNTKGNPNTDRPQTNADLNTQAPTTVNPTEGRSSRSGGPTY
jgi:putative membrane protein